MNKSLHIYQASAGSGKTRTLVKEYLTLAFANQANYKNTLAITFTNKATEEMKNRVVGYLVELSEGKQAELANEIILELNNRGVDAKNFEVKKAASQVLSSILHDYSSFNISTIDSFCIRVIKSFAKELGLPIGFKLELDSESVLEKLTNSLLDNIGKDDNLTKYIEDYIVYQLNGDKTWNIDSDIKEFGKQILSEQFWKRKFITNDDVYDDKGRMLNLISGIKSLKFSVEESLKSEGKKIIDALNAENVSYGDLVGGKTGSILRYAEKLQSEVAGPPSLTMKAFDAGKSLFKVKAGCEPVVLNSLRKILDILAEKLIQYNTANAIFKTIYNIGILGDLIRLLDSYRKENRTILSTDINNFLRLIISDDVSPFIYEKVGVKLKHFMLDEFQDTSQFQWDNIKPLLVNSLSEENSSLIVGDVKQSIYRWRNGDMRLLLNGVEEDLNSFKELISKKTLKTNFRTHKEIVEFNNLFFESLKEFFEKTQEDGYSNQYLIQSYDKDVTSQDVNEKKNDGYVEINFFDDDKESELKSNEESEKRVVEILSELKEDGYKPGDVLVLVRTESDSRDISEVITKAGYSVVSALSLLLKNSSKVNFIISTLKYLADSSNKLARTEMLYNYNQFSGGTKSDLEVFDDSLDVTGKIFLELLPDEFFKPNEKPKRLPVLYNLTAYELVEHIVGIFKLNVNADPYIINFVDEVYKFSKEKESDVNSFLEYWEEKKDKLSINLPEDKNSVRVMTIHKSKGLESKVVIVPYANWEIDIDGKKDEIWASADEPPFNKASAYYIKATKEVSETLFAEDYAEEAKLVRVDNINLLYVTFTRPEERLYINVPSKRNKSIASVINAVIYADYKDRIKDNRLILGERKPREKDDDTDAAHKSYTKLKNFNSSPYYKKLFIRPSYRKLKVFENERMKIKTDNGVVVHKLLSYIMTKDDVDSALNKGLIEGIISTAEKEKFRALLLKTINSETAEKWFDGSYEVKPESDILTKDNKVLRPDRVMIKGDDAIIIDYKTGREEKKHSEQLTEYAKVLTEMGYKNVDMFLLYINDYKDEITINVKKLNGGK